MTRAARSFPSFSFARSRGILPLLLSFCLLAGLPALAQTNSTAATNGTAGDDACTATTKLGYVCTNDKFFDVNGPCSISARLGGVLEDIITRVVNATNTASETLYTTITADQGFNYAVDAALTLFIIFFAVAFMFGFVQMTMKEGIFRLIKIGVIFWVISPSGWTVFNTVIVQFFNGGTSQLINAMINITNQGAAISPDDPVGPFKILDQSINMVFSPRMMVTMVACLTTPPYGPLVAIALGYSIFEFIKAMLKVLLVYALSLIAKALLLGVAPIFFVFLLFERTKGLFQNWINQLVNFSLQPILMFAFLSFFFVLIDTSASAILKPNQTNVCFSKAGFSGGSPFDISAWKFVCPSNGQLLPFSGQSGVNGMVGCPGSKDAFPISIINILIFLLIVHIAGSIIDIITTLAGELSQGVTRLDQVGGAFDQWLGGGGRGGPTQDEYNLASRRSAPKT